VLRPAAEGGAAYSRRLRLVDELAAPWTARLWRADSVAGITRKLNQICLFEILGSSGAVIGSGCLPCQSQDSAFRLPAVQYAVLVLFVPRAHQSVTRDVEE
jgi:hypothetical protein